MAIYKPKSISGFPEWLPEVRALELQWLDTMRRTFEQYGFCNIETPVVEELDVLLAKGETDKEIYTLHRLQADEKDSSDARLGLHFDQTVPFARYTAQHFNDLTFPFKRYQMQKVWRGERPQEGRFREFYQCDIDVINPEQLPLHFDAELPAIIDEILQKLNIGRYEIRMNNRKLITGYLLGLGLDDNMVSPVTRILDKRDKIGGDGVVNMLVSQLALDSELAKRCAAIANITAKNTADLAQLKTLGVDHPLFLEGVSELTYVMDGLQNFVGSRAVVDCSIIRGFDYYTGTVYELHHLDFPQIGAFGGGGRYDDLAGSYINKKLPGVGISIGFTRFFSIMVQKGIAKPLRPYPTQVLVTVPSDAHRTQALNIASQLRAKGLSVEVFHQPQKMQKQLAYADKKQIPYVWFTPENDGDAHQVKNMATGTQTNTTIDSFAC